MFFLLKVAASKTLLFADSAIVSLGKQGFWSYTGRDDNAIALTAILEMLESSNDGRFKQRVSQQSCNRQLRVFLKRLCIYGYIFFGFIPSDMLMALYKLRIIIIIKF